MTPGPYSDHVDPIWTMGDEAPQRIDDYSTIKDPQFDSISIACKMTGQPHDHQYRSHWELVRACIKDDRFRDILRRLFGEMKCDVIRSPGAVLTRKLSLAYREHQRQH